MAKNPEDVSVLDFSATFQFIAGIQGRSLIDNIAVNVAVSPASRSSCQPLPSVFVPVIDWERFDTVASRAPMLRLVVFELISQDDLAVFEREVEPRLPHLRSAGRLKYAIHEPQSPQARPD